MQQILSEGLRMSMVAAKFVRRLLITPTHTALSMLQFLTKNCVTAVSYSPIRPIQAPVTFYYFPQ